MNFFGLIARERAILQNSICVIAGPWKYYAFRGTFFDFIENKFIYSFALTFLSWQSLDNRFIQNRMFLFFLSGNDII